MKNDSYKSLFKDQSTRSLNKYRNDNIEQRVQQIVSKDLVVGPNQRRRESGNQFTITTNFASQMPKKQPVRNDEDLLKRVRLLEAELKRKISEDVILKNLFKTKTPAEISQLDLYLQFKKIEEQSRTYNEKLLAMAKKEEDFRQKEKVLETNLQKQQTEHMENIEEFAKQLEQKEQEWKGEKKWLKEEAERWRQEYENNMFLMEEIKKKNKELVVKVKQLNQELQIEREANSLEIIQQREEYAREKDELMKEIEEVNQTNEQLKQEYEKTVRELQDLYKEKQHHKSQVDRLEQIIMEYQQKVDDIKANNEQSKAKQNKYYQSLKIDYEIEIQNISKNYEDKLKVIQQKSKSYEDQNAILRKQINDLQSQAKEAKLAISKFESAILVMQEKESKLSCQFMRSQKQNEKVVGELTKLKFERDEIASINEKMKSQLADKEKELSKIESKLYAICQQKENTAKQCEQYKKQYEYSQSFSKLNDKVYNQNYKTLGRLIQINHKIKSILLDESCQILHKSINEQSLTEVISYQTELLQHLMKSYSKEKKKIQDLHRQKNSENREISIILEQCKNFINNEYAQNLLSKYIVLIKERRYVNNEHAMNEKIEIYQELIENLMNLHNIKFYCSENPHSKEINANTRDSLESIYLHKPVTESSKKYSRHIMIEKEDSIKQHRRKERVETEPCSDYNRPSLKAKLFIDEENKENIDLNKFEGEIEIKRNEPKRYINEIRERISNKYPSKAKDRKLEVDRRSEIEKKYFRS